MFRKKERKTALKSGCIFLANRYNEKRSSERAMDMLKVLDVFPVGDKLSVTLEGNCINVKNGSVLKDTDNTEYRVLSVAMVGNDDPADLSKATTVLMPFCDIRKGCTLQIV